METGKFTPREYLNKYLEPKPEIKFDVETSVPFFNDGFQGEYIGHEGVIEHGDGQKSIRIEYEALEPEFQEKLLNNTKNSEFRSEELKKEQSEFFSSPVFLLNDFKITKSETGETLDLKTFFPEGGQIIMFNPKKPYELHSKGSMVSIIENVMFLEGDLVNLESILDLAHEGSHHLNKDVHYDIKRKKKYLKSKDSANILLRERDAWALALRKLKPFIEKDKMEYISSYIHQNALWSYSDSLRGETVPDWIINTLEFVKKIIKGS